jgi:chitin disaccharide deacetylase
LSDRANNLPACPVAAGVRYFFDRRLRGELRDEMAGQFERFHRTGLTLDHVNGHLNIHLHPVVLAILMENAGEWGITHLRVTDDPFCLNSRLALGHWSYRASHAAIYRILSARARPLLRARNIRCTERVFGLLQNARVDEEFLLKLLPELPPGDSELYSHPSLDEFRHELLALISPRVVERVAQLGIKLSRYQEL